MATGGKKPRPPPPPRLFAPVRGDAGGAVTWRPLGAGLTLAPRPLRPGAAAGRAEPRGQAWASSSPSSGASSGTKVGAGGSGLGWVGLGFPQRGAPRQLSSPLPRRSVSGGLGACEGGLGRCWWRCGDPKKPPPSPAECPFLPGAPRGKGSCRAQRLRLPLARLP